MRLIDADALLAKKGEAWDADGNLLYVVGTGNIMAAPTVNKWISVKDRLPEKSGPVLVCIGEFQNMTTLEYSVKHHAFNAYDELPDAENTIDNVTHWMPLPEPPKEMTEI